MSTIIMPVMIPVDNRPESFTSHFRTKNNVDVRITLYTREESVANSIMDDFAGKVDWQHIRRPANTSVAGAIGQAFAISLGIGFVAWVVMLFGLFIWDVADLPVPQVLSSQYGLFGGMDFYMAWTTRIALTITLLAMVIGMPLAALDARKNRKSEPVNN